MRAAVPIALLLAIGANAQPARFESSIKPFVKNHCQGCHNAKARSGDLDLARFLKLDARAALAEREVWERIAEKLRHGMMPPPPAKVNEAQSKTVIGWIDAELDRIDRAAGPNPGRVTARRLNRAEYNNTVRDLLGVTVRPADDFPVDEAGYGFDNIGDVLSMSPVLTERYLKAAREVARAAVIVPREQVASTVQHYTAEQIDQIGRMRLTIEHEFPADGEYTIRGTFYQALKNGTKLTGRNYLDGKLLSETPLSFFYEMDRAWEAKDVLIPAGKHKVETVLEIEAGYQGNLPYVDSLDIRGPLRQRQPEPPVSHKTLIPCGHPFGGHNGACARKVAAPLVRRAYRRPVRDAEIDRVAGFIQLAQDRGDSFEQGVRLALQAVLVSPHFLFRIERDPAPAAAAYRIGEHELASRLSYFLWSSMPDEELSRLADSGRLRAPGALDAQVRRMLADAKSRALVENFAGQWLQLRNLETAAPDPKQFPAFDDALRAAMRTETEMFFESILRENRSVLEFLDGRFTFLNERLAKHYGIGGVEGAEFRRVELDGVRRGGVLTHASVLTVSSYPTRTSAVIRGKWILENLLNAPPPPPPPDVPPLDEKAVLTGTMRQQLEKHRTNALCSSCHSRLDPLGFGLENYDATGAWRDTEAGQPVDAAGVAPNGKPFSSPAQLKQMLRADPDTFARALTEKLLTYALGRGLERYDRPHTQAIVARGAASGYKFHALVTGIVASMPFQMRRSEP